MRAPRRDDHVELLAGEHIAELPRLLFEPGDRLRVRDLLFMIGDLLRQRRILGCERGDLGVEMTALGHLPVHRERHQPADTCDHDNCNPAKGDRALDTWTWGGTDGTILFPALSETNEAM